jgi:hypothetical protein
MELTKRVWSVRAAKGDWEIGERYREPDGFGLSLPSGFVVRRFGAELLGPGDLLRPWQTVGPFATRPFEPVWSVVAPTPPRAAPSWRSPRSSSTCRLPMRSWESWSPRGSGTWLLRDGPPIDYADLVA